MAKSNVIIKQKKSETEIVDIYPQTESNIVINNSTEITGDTVTDVFDSALPLTAGKNISINSKDTGIEISFTGSLAPNVEVKGTTPITVTGSTTNTSATYTVSIKDASTTQKGAVQLSDSTSSTSTTTAATPSAVKAAYDLASGKQTAFADGSAIIATASGGTITIKAGVSQSGGTISNSSGSDISTYTKNQIDSLVAGLTKYLGTATAAANLTGASTANAGDFFRVTNSFTVSGWGTAHVGDLVILKKDAGAGDYATITNWEIIHTGDNTSYGVVNNTTDGLAPKWSTLDTTKVASSNYVLMNDGANVKWRQLPSTSFSDNNTIYTLSNGDTTNTVKLTPSSGNAQTVTINNVAHASSADQASIATEVSNALTVQFNGTNQFTYNGSAAKTLNITASGIDAAASNHTHGNITNAGTITSDTSVGNGDKIVIIDKDNNKIARSSIEFNGSISQALSGNGTWETFLKSNENITINSGLKHKNLDTDDDVSIISDPNPTQLKLGESGIGKGIYSAIEVNKQGIAIAGSQVIKYYAWGTTDTFIKEDPNLASGGFALVEIA